LFGFLVVLGSAIGIGAFVPTVFKSDDRIWFSIRYLAGFCAITIILFLGNFVFKIPLHFLGWGILAIALLGCAQILRQLDLKNIIKPNVIFHPFTLFLLLYLVVVSTKGGFAYQIFLGDEFTNWVGWARQMVILDQAVSKAMISVPIYTPGWTLYLAFPGILLGYFDSSQLIALPFLMHLGFLVVLFDIVFTTFSRHLKASNSFLLAWIFVLLFLAVETSWKLAPENLLSERPQIYVVSACFLLAFVALNNSVHRLQISWVIGILFAAAYLIKTASIILFPSILFIALCIAFADKKYSDENFSDRQEYSLYIVRGLKIVGAVIIPFLIIYLLWKIAPRDNSCAATPLNLLFSEDMSIFAGDRASELASRYFPGIWAYFSSFKASLSALAVLGLLISFKRPQTATISVALIGYSILYTLALYWVYLTCYGGYQYEILSSLQRFIRVPIRVAHIVGLTLLVISLFQWCTVSYPQILTKTKAIKFFPLTGLVVAFALFGWIGSELSRSIENASSRPDQKNAAWLTTVVDLTHDTRQLVSIIKEREMKDPNLLFIAQGGNGDQRLPIHLESLGLKRGDPVRWFKFPNKGNFGVVKKDLWTVKTNQKALRKLMLRQDIILPIKIDPWIKQVLETIISEETCKKNPLNYFLFKDPKNSENFECVTK